MAAAVFDTMSKDGFGGKDFSSVFQYLNEGKLQNK